MWLDHSDFTDIANLWDIGNEHLDYAFAKYAVENSLTIRYGRVYKRSSGECISGQYKFKVLVNLQTLNREEFYARGN